jgi:RNA polymerase sigma-70 factor (ECF subfamily)
VPHAPDVRAQEAEFARLLDGARQGDVPALGALLQHYRPYLLLIANHELGDNVRAKAGPSDLVQDTLLRAQQRFGQFRGGKEEELLGWLRVILRRRLADFVRSLPEHELKGVAELDSGMADDGDTPSGPMGRQDEIDRVRKALEQMSEDYQQVVKLREYEELTYEEIGQRMQRSPEAVRKLWTRAIDQLGQILKAKDGD